MGKKSLFEKVLQKMTHSKDKSPSGLAKYPLVVLGSQAGGALTHQIANKTHGAIPMLNISKLETAQAYMLRCLYEQTRIISDKYLVKRIFFFIYPNS